MKKYISIFLSLVLALSLFSGCAGTGNTDISGTAGEQTGETAPPTEVDFSKTDADMFTDRDRDADYDTGSAVTITLNGTTASASSDSVKISGSTVTITEEATYVISGTLSGMLVVDAPDTAKLQLVFNGVEITGETSAALYILEADKVFLTLAAGSQNTLANGGEFIAIDGNNIDAALFSKQDLTLNGAGSLTVTSPAGHGIVCKDDLVITGGTYTVNAASHALNANDSVRIAGGVFTIDAGKDAIHCENSDDASLGFIYIAGGTVKAEAEGDGIAAGAYLQIEGGTFDLLIGGGSENGTKASSGGYGGFMDRGPGGMPPDGMNPGGMNPGGNRNDSSTTENAVSMKGLKAESGILISGGTFRIDSADDSIHSNASVTVNGGTFAIASGDDALHAEENLTVTACDMEITESYEGLEALHIAIQGGNITLTASDDGLNAAGGTDLSGTAGGRDGMFGGGRGGMGGGMSAGNGSIVISGGNLFITASGDGIDSNGTLEISGGYTVVMGPTQGDTATLDYDRSAVISGGTFIGTGASGMAQTFSDSAQGVFAVNTGNQSAGTTIVLKDKNGNTVLEYTPSLPFAVLIFSSSDIVSGETYSITVGSSSGEFEAN